jgi:hypothetical protein
MVITGVRPSGGMGYRLRDPNNPLETRSVEEYLVRLKKLEPEAERIKEQMQRQVQLSPDIWNFRFTV